MKDLSIYITEKYKINKDTNSSFFNVILQKLEEYDSPYRENTLHIPGEVCRDIYYDRGKTWRIMSIAPGDEDNSLELELQKDDYESEKTVTIGEKQFKKIFSDEDIEEIINTLDEN